VQRLTRGGHKEGVARPLSYGPRPCQASTIQVKHLKLNLHPRITSMLGINVERSMHMDPWSHNKRTNVTTIQQVPWLASMTCGKSGHSPRSPPLLGTLEAQPPSTDFRHASLHVVNLRHPSKVGSRSVHPRVKVERHMD